MNPNLNHAQCRPGHNVGYKSGVLDGRMMIPALEGSLLISGSPELSASELEGLKSWADDYFKWLTTSELALQESGSKNNHGSYYDVQALYFALYADNHVAAKNIAEEFLQKRVYAQIQADGTMPEEMARTRPLFYSIYNLHAMLLAGHLAEKVGVDIWEGSESDARLKSAVDLLVPYADSNKVWPHPTIGDLDRIELFDIIKMANRAYPTQNYLQFQDKLSLEKRSDHRSNLAYPRMR